MADRDKVSLYGSGLDYPLRIDPDTGAYARVEGVDSVRASLYRLFDTSPGEDFFNPEYGCAIKNLVFEQDSQVFRALAETAIRRAVGRWEPRIAEVTEVTLGRDDETSPNLVMIEVSFRLIESQVEDNFVYPFNLR